MNQGPLGRVLFADDDKEVLRACGERLRAMSFEVRTVTTAENALTEIEHWQPDVLLADLLMPGNERLELLGSLAASGKGLPVIVLTAYPSLQTVLDSLRLGVVDYVAKPPDWEDLNQRLLRAIKLGKALALLERGEDRLARLAEWLDQVRAVVTVEASSPPQNNSAPASSPLEALKPGERAALSNREAQVLTMLSSGQTAQQIARSLGLSTNTVRVHIRSLFVKLNVKSQVALLAKLHGRR